MAPTPATTRSSPGSRASRERQGMRDRADAERVRRLAAELGRAVPAGTKMYLTGGATAVLEGWRESTVDIDVRFEPDSDAALRKIAALKEELAVNVELASPLDFLPELPGWRERSRFRFRERNLEVFDFDLYSQALSKLQRGFELDLEDVRAAQQLAQRYAPIAMLREQTDPPCKTSEEQYQPTSVDAVLGNPTVTLTHELPDGRLEDVKRAPSAADIAGLREGYYLDYEGRV